MSFTTPFFPTVSYSGLDMSRLAIAASAFLLTGTLAGQAQTRSGSGSSIPEEGQRIYSSRPNDPWNQIFTALFTRTVETRLSDELGGSEPHEPLSSLDYLNLSVSRRTVKRTEGGDRAIEPLYPSFLSARGVVQVLTEPLYSKLKAALESAFGERTKRTPLRRALMQSDLWAAYDVLEARGRFRRGDADALLQRRSQLLALTARLIRKLALTPSEIEALPNNYSARREEPPLPGLFEKEAGWIEIQWVPERIHDFAADHRRAARVFVKPLSSAADRNVFLQDFRRTRRPAEKLHAAALAIQLLLVTDRGRVVPSPIISAVQLRTFVRNPEGEIAGGRVEQFELGRRLLLEDAATGGFVHYEEGDPAYLPSGGNDYGFASWQLGDAGRQPPVLAALRSRCQACHYDNMARIVTLAMHARPPVPPIVSLDPLGNERASHVAAKKQASDQFQALLQRWQLP